MPCTHNQHPLPLYLCKISKISQPNLLPYTYRCSQCKYLFCINHYITHILMLGRYLNHRIYLRCTTMHINIGSKFDALTSNQWNQIANNISNPTIKLCQLSSKKFAEIGLKFIETHNFRTISISWAGIRGDIFTKVTNQLLVRAISSSKYLTTLGKWLTYTLKEVIFQLTPQLYWLR